MTLPLILVPSAPPLAACQSYLEQQLAAREIALPVGYTPPAGEPSQYALISQLGFTRRGVSFVADVLLRVRVYNTDAWVCAQHAMFLHAAMVGAAQQHISIPTVGEFWVTGAAHEYGPVDFDDPDIPLLNRSPIFGQDMAVSWTTPLKPIQEVTP